MSLYVIGIGGTGAKCIEAVTHLTAIGLMQPGGNHSAIHTVFVDPDETNGSLKRAKETIEHYQACFQGRSGASQGWMNTRLENLGAWSPFRGVATDKKLETFLEKSLLDQHNPGLAHLFDVLYTQDEQRAELDVGFRGRPAIGAAVMSQVDLDRLDEPLWHQLIETISSQAGSAGETAEIMLFGSIFGGTGASGLPTLGQLIRQKLEKENLNAKFALAGVFILPYFTFSPKPEEAEAEKVFARADKFVLNSEAALRYYLSQAEAIFDRVYLVGNASQTKVEFSVGKETQCNTPHFVELYAALAARDFQQDQSQAQSSNSPSPKKPAKDDLVRIISRQRADVLSWADLPSDRGLTSTFEKATRFAYVWLSNIAPELTRARDVGVQAIQRDAPWFKAYYQPELGLLGILGGSRKEMPDINDPQEADTIKRINRWCEDYLRWLQDIHTCGDMEIQLFQTTYFPRTVGSQVSTSDQLSSLVFNRGQGRDQKQQDTISNLKLKLTDPETQKSAGVGTFGLARAVYYLC